MHDSFVVFEASHKVAFVSIGALWRSCCLLFLLSAYRFQAMQERATPPNVDASNSAIGILKKETETTADEGAYNFHQTSPS